MADNLDFNVQLRLLNEQFNNGVNQARDKFGELRQSIERNVAQMNTDTELAATLIGNLANVSPDRLTAELSRVSTELRQMGAGANLTREQLDNAMSAAALQVTRLARELEVARAETVRLSDTPATPAQLAEAAAKVGNLTSSVEAAQLKVERLSRTNGTPEQIEAAKAKVDSLGDSLTEARAKVTQMSQTRGTPEDIDSAKGKVDNLGSSLSEARLRVQQLSQTRGSPAEIEAAKTKIDNLASAVDAARLNVEQLSRTNGTPTDIIEAKGRVDSVTNSLDAARLSVEQLSRTNGTLSDIAQAKAKVDLLGSSIDDAKNKVTELSRTVGTPNDIAEAKNRVNDLGLSIDAAKLKVRELSETKGTPQDIDNAKAKIVSLKDELAAAKSVTKMLSETNASPQDIEAAQNKVRALTAYISGTQDEVKRLRETKGTPEDIANAKAEFNALQATVVEAKNQVKLLSQTRGTPEDIAAAKGKVNELGQSLVDAKNEAKRLSDTNASPQEIAAAKDRVNELKGTLSATRDEVRLLSQTSASPTEIAEARARLAGLNQDLVGARSEARQLNQTSGSPAEILEAKAKVNELKDSLSAARDEVRNLSQSNASPADIAEAKARVAALKAELGDARGEARLLSQTSGSPADIAAAIADVARLDTELNDARLAAQQLSQTGASPAELAEAAERVNRLEQELGQASNASERLSNELAGAMNRASNTADNARNAIYRMANVRVPETIRAEIDEISRSLANFQNNSGRPAAEIERVTRATEERIRQLRNELNGLDDTQDRVSQGSSGLGGNINRLQGAFGSLQGLLAAAGLGIGVAEIIETADAFKNLEARIKLVTGEGAQFVTAFEGVKEIANATFSSVESTGELFTRIAKSSEALGLAQSEVLSITETINQAMKLSGGSAASVDAAITQLIQGLQSGVVRGEEFNSIMEQAPRLAQAMADGLGVTRGELRGMAQDGKLTSEVVINAVRSQAQVLNDEFATLPTTVSNSLQVVKNQIFNFVGEIDGSLNQTSKLAEAISYIGDSLESLDPSLVSALTGAFQNTIEAVVEVAKLIKQAYDNATAQINFLAGASEDTSEKVGLITAALHGVSVVTGAVADGIKGLAIVGNIVSAVLAEWAALATRFYASLTFGDGKKAILELADSLDNAASAAWERANTGAMAFESSTAKAMNNAAKTAKDRFAEMAVDAQAAYDQMVVSGNASAEALQEQFVKVAQAKIQANDGVVSDTLRLELAEKNLQAVVDDTGKVVIESAKAMQAAYLGVGESFAEVALKAQESGKSIELSLVEAISKANTRGAVDDIVLSLQAMESQGLITGQQLALGQNIAKTQMNNVEQQIGKNMETFAAYAADVIQKEGGITAANRQTILSQLQNVAATENLGVQFSETNGVIITELDKTTVASGRTKDEIDSLAGAFGVGLSKEFVKSKAGLADLIDGFDDLKNSGYDVSGALVQALTEMSNKAKNTQELDDLRATWIELGKEGKLSAQDLKDGLDDVNNKADQLTDGINSVAEAYGFLGIKTREELAKSAALYTEANRRVMEEGKLTAQQQREVFEKTAKANIAANGDVIDSYTKKQAAVMGVTVEIDKNGRATFTYAKDAVPANDRVTSSVDKISGAHRNLNSAARSSGNAMVQAADNARSAYDKLQDSIKAAKEAQAVKGGDETLRNIRQYGTETRPVEGNQFGTRLGVENFLKGQGLTEAQAIEEARKLYAKQGTSSGALNFGEMQGYRDGQMLTTADLAKFKTASMYLAEIAQKTKDAAAQQEKYESRLNRLPDSALQAVSSLSKQPSFDAGNNNTGGKSYNVKFTLGGITANASVPESQAGMFERMMQELQDSKAIAGY